MANIEAIAASAGVSWRTLVKATPGLAGPVADALCTRQRFRTDQQRGIIAAAQGITDGDTDKERREKTRRRMEGVNAIESGRRVRGRTLDAGGQPRGQHRERQGTRRRRGGS